MKIYDVLNSAPLCTGLTAECSSYLYSSEYLFIIISPTLTARRMINILKLGKYFGSASLTGRLWCKFISMNCAEQTMNGGTGWTEN